MAEVAGGYSNLEYDLQTGQRGSRHGHVEGLLSRLTGAPAAVVVNNNAAAVLLVLAELAAGREVVVSRGQAVEIGGGFRIPDVLRQSGARLVEVGTTNRTRLADYAGAAGPETGAFLLVHASNFRIVGFTEEVSATELSSLGRERGIPVVADQGSGCLLQTERFGIPPALHEPLVQEYVAGGADLVCFSGDKLLGGPQCGIIAGREDLVARLKRHPLTRALRPDKATLAALAATLRHYQLEEAEREVPVWRMIGASLDSLGARAAAWAARLSAGGVRATPEGAEFGHRRGLPPRRHPPHRRAPGAPPAPLRKRRREPAQGGRPACGGPHRRRPPAARPAHRAPGRRRLLAGRPRLAVAPPARPRRVPPAGAREGQASALALDSASGWSYNRDGPAGTRGRGVHSLPACPIRPVELRAWLSVLCFSATREAARRHSTRVECNGRQDGVSDP